MREGISLIAVSLSLFLAAAANAAVVWNETVNGDLSGLPGSPTPIGLGIGTNSIAGTLRTSSAADNQDWLAVTVPAGLGLSQYVHTAFTSTDSIAFTGFQTGSSFVGSPGAAGSYNGYTHFTPGTVGSNLFPAMQSAAGATGFSVPLGPGTYTFLLQQTGSAATAYGFDFVVIPEPTSAGIILLGGMLVIGTRRRVQSRDDSV